MCVLMCCKYYKHIYSNDNSNSIDIVKIDGDDVVLKKMKSRLGEQLKLIMIADEDGSHNYTDNCNKNPENTYLRNEDSSLDSKVIISGITNNDDHNEVDIDDSNDRNIDSQSNIY